MPSAAEICNGAVGPGFGFRIGIGIESSSRGTGEGVASWWEWDGTEEIEGVPDAGSHSQATISHPSLLLHSEKSFLQCSNCSNLICYSPSK